jgi:hypothetical protein
VDKKPCFKLIIKESMYDLDDGLRSLLVIASSSILWCLGVLKKQCIFSTKPKHFLIDYCSYDEDTAKFNVWAAQ